MYKILKAISKIHPDIKFNRLTELDSRDNIKREIQEYLERNGYHLELDTPLEDIDASDPRLRDILDQLKILNRIIPLIYETSKMYTWDFNFIDAPINIENA